MSRRPAGGRAAAPRERETVGVVVEGETEFHALALLHRLVPGCPPLKAVNLGGLGGDMKPLGIAKRVCPKIEAHLIKGRTKVIVCLDREDRSECVGAFAQSVHREIEAQLGARGKLPRAPRSVHVVVVNRAFEAWILADAAGLRARGVFTRAPSFHCFEGEEGKRGQKGAVEIAELQERPYIKTKDGPRLFERIHFQDARRWGGGQRGSRSLDKLLRTLGV